MIGNQDLLTTLIDVLNQATQVKTEKNRIFCNDMALSAYEEAFDLLEKEGIVKWYKIGEYKGLWEILKWS